MTQTERSLIEEPGAQPFLFEGSRLGVLFLHGFTSTPQSVRAVARRLHESTQATVMGPLLAGHGTVPEDLARTGHLDWVRSAEGALDTLRGRCDRVIIGGLSLGATIALNIAARRPGDIDGVFSINGSTGLYRPEVVAPLYAEDAAEFVPGIGSDIARHGVREVCYDRIPRSTLQHRFLLTNATGALLPLLRSRLLILQSRTDNVVAPANATTIACAAGSDDIRMVWLSRSLHVATLDHDDALIAHVLSQFVLRDTEADAHPLVEEAQA
ncbi:Thermostable monoacylglycerol lipase [Roseivivax sp. THAF40]|uniref:alpha/beta hydrolase n=1 Tax=unclassified Roseivivax TaxID=2639302 RepID=UPI001267DE34|nr:MULTISPECIES: alpha/beta fold hydrolase [unclassified Roseivivax]QFS84020.1 Thermostable monoacylglycerol lipase [Roseivivax sp. THAF197b]QFT47847.1 Thermostable monoacylglycerol lipase [Roseivivax sp. THAF40]